MTTFGIIVIVVVIAGLLVWAFWPSRVPTKVVVITPPPVKEGFKTDAETPHTKVEPKVAGVSKATVTKKAPVKVPVKKAVRKVTKKTK